MLTCQIGLAVGIGITTGATVTVSLCTDAVGGVAREARIVGASASPNSRNAPAEIAAIKARHAAAGPAIPLLSSSCIMPTQRPLAENVSAKSAELPAAGNSFRTPIWANVAFDSLIFRYGSYGGCEVATLLLVFGSCHDQSLQLRCPTLQRAMLFKAYSHIP